MNILFRGGAIAAGKGVGYSYIKIIEQYYSNASIKIINKTHETDNSFDAVWTYYTDIYPYKPDILVFHFGMNDAYFPVYRSEFKENLVQLVRLARKQFNSRIILLTSHPFENQYDMNMIHIYYRTIREVAVDLHCYEIPIHIYWAGYITEHNITTDQLVLQDTRYPNDKGHKIYAQAIINKLEKIIEGEIYGHNNKRYTKKQ